MQSGFGQGGQPPGYPPGPPGGGNPPGGWQQPTQLAQSSASGYGAPGPGTVPQPPMGGAPGGFAPPPPQDPMGYGQAPGMAPGMAPPGMSPGMPPPGMAPMTPPGMSPGMAPPGMGPPMQYGIPGSGAGFYEFNDTENQKVNKLAGRMMTAGIMQIIFGAVSLIGNWFLGVTNGVLGIPGAIAMIIIGALFASAASSFKNISNTQGNDMGHLMAAMDKLAMASLVQIVGYILAAALFVIGIILAVFLFAALFVAAH